MQIRLPSGHRGLSNDGMNDQTLTKVSLYLDGILVDRDSLAWDKGALVTGLLEGHKEFTWDRNQKQRRVFETNVPIWVSRVEITWHISSVISDNPIRDSARVSISHHN